MVPTFKVAPSGTPLIKKLRQPVLNFVTYEYKFQCMKKIVVVIILLAFIGAVAFARLTMTNRTEKKKGPEKQEQKIEQKKEAKRHCMFS